LYHLGAAAAAAGCCCCGGGGRDEAAAACIFESPSSFLRSSVVSFMIAWRQQEERGCRALELRHPCVQDIVVCKEKRWMVIYCSNDAVFIFAYLVVWWWRQALIIRCCFPLQLLGSAFSMAPRRAAKRPFAWRAVTWTFLTRQVCRRHCHFQSTRNYVLQSLRKARRRY